MIFDAQFQVGCDNPNGCPHRTEDTYSGTALAGGGYDTRNIPGELQRDGWRVEGETTICPECVEDERAAAEDQPCSAAD